MTQEKRPDAISDRKLEKRLRHECLDCSGQALPDSDFCEPHRNANRKRARDGAKKRRQGYRHNGRCVDCGRRSKKWRCPRCYRKSRGVKAQSKGVTKNEIWRVDPGTTWSRFRGKGRRGRLTREEQQVEDERDARFAIAAIEQFIVESKRLVTPSVLELPKIQRDEERRKVTAHLARAGRFLDELADKYGAGA